MFFVVVLKNKLPVNLGLFAGCCPILLTDIIKKDFLCGQNFSFGNFAQEKVQNSHLKSHNICESWRKRRKKRLKCIIFWFASTILKILCKLLKILCGRKTVRPWHLETLFLYLSFIWNSYEIFIWHFAVQKIPIYKNWPDLDNTVILHMYIAGQSWKKQVAWVLQNPIFKNKELLPNLSCFSLNFDIRPKWYHWKYCWNIMKISW